jgi:hypothetical protein
MNALELCMYVRGLDTVHGKMCLIGAVSERDRPLLSGVDLIADDSELPNAVLDRVRTAAHVRPRITRTRSLVSG